MGTEYTLNCSGFVLGITSFAAQQMTCLTLMLEITQFA